MNKLISILFFVIVHLNIWAQPAPCSGEGLDIVENIQNIDYNNTEISTKTIKLKINPKNYYKWSDIIINDTIDTNKLILENSGYKYCSNIRYKSKLNNRFYLANSFADDVLIIQNGSKKMYIVFPCQNRVENEYFFGAIVDSLSKLNTPKGKRAYFNPNMYISNIEFKEGIFFIKDYDKKFGIKSFDKNDITEFFPDKNVFDNRNPKNYWSNKVSFISMFDEKNKPEYTKVVEGNYTENQAIELIAKNYPPIIKKILGSPVSIINNREYRTQHQEDLFEIWYNLLEGNFRNKEFELFKKFESKEISIDDAYKEYKNFLKTEFFSILSLDFDLSLKYYKYFIDENADLKPFKEFILKNKSEFTKEQLDIFINNLDK